MRITGGKARGITLQTPRGQKTRPAADAVRESLFSSLGELVIDSRVLDLFAGTGSYGLEALSRGAQQVHFVESDTRCVACIKENLERVLRSSGGVKAVAKVSRIDAKKWTDKEPGSWDIVIADPPYEDISSVQERLFGIAERSLQPDGWLVLEQPANLDLAVEGWSEVKRLGKKRGDGPALSFWKRA